MDPFSSNLQVPDSSAGPSRGAQRPSSVQAVNNADRAQPSASANSRKRASHSVVSGYQHEEQPAYRDVYAHPAAVEYAAAHPKRTIPKFGPYLLLRTLGEGEFGKVKLGLHTQWGEEVAVKLIRRGNIDSTVRMTKVEREIEVLRTLKHPNIVRLYDVIETDKYIGIILEYASGGELFDHILAHRYLREKDACKLFSQLISGVWYIHQKKIVHRDLKLENLLLDRNRNVIITDFGFANRFEHRSDDLMQTSCGSPCYAAPELVISDGLYVGSAVDIWSCGVILYAMLAGYLPFDDDPANPDGDNINLLYKYIVNTPLSFPDYISAEARDLLGMMLVPDPTRRADLPAIMAHRWLAPYAHTFSKSVDDLERAAMEQHHQKRLAYQKQMRQATADPSANKMVRSHSAAINGATHSPRSHRAQPEYLYETSGDQSVYSTSTPAARRGVSSAIVLPTSPAMSVDDDPFAPTPTQETPTISIPPTPLAAPPINGQSGDVQEEPRAYKEGSSDEKPQPVQPTIAPVKMSPDAKRKGAFRHTIQVEYGDSGEGQLHQKQASELPSHVPRRSPSARGADRNGIPAPAATERRASTKKPPPELEPAIAKLLPVSPSSAQQKENLQPPQLPLPAKSEPAQPVVSIEVTSPPASPEAGDEKVVNKSGTHSSGGSGSSARGAHKRGLSIDKISIAKIFGNGAEAPVQANGSMARSASQKSSPGHNASSDTITSPKPEPASRRPSTLQVPPSPAPASEQVLLSPESAASAKKARRNTLTVMVEPFRASIRRGTKSRAASGDAPPAQEQASPAVESEKIAEVISPNVETPQATKEIVPPTTPQFTPQSIGAVPASTFKANKVTQWFRSKSKGKAPVDPVEEPERQTPDVAQPSAVDNAAISSTSTVDIAATTPLASEKPVRAGWSGHPSRSASAAADTPSSDRRFTANVFGRVAGSSSTPVPKGALRIHHGASDNRTITNEPPPEVMRKVRKVIEDMGVEIQIEGEYKYRCVRPKRRKAAGSGLGLREGGGSLTAFTMVGSAASSGVDKRGLPMPPQSLSSFGSSTGGMLRGLLMRRQSSQVSSPAHSEPENSPEAAMAAAVPPVDAPASITGEPIYGDAQQDQGDEVRFSVELTRIDRLDGTYSLDIRRLKGNLRSYKFLYDTLRDRANLQR